MNIRKATTADYDSVWDIFHAVVKTADTYVFAPDTAKADLAKHWFADYMETYVAEIEGDIVGTYIIKPNQIGLGNHIANCSYMIHPKIQGKGIGRKLCEHSLAVAKARAFRGIQFNIVVSTNENAVRLWKKFGFEIIGTTPEGFRYPQHGFVDTYIMYKHLH